MRVRLGLWEGGWWWWGVLFCGGGGGGGGAGLVYGRVGGVRKNPRPAGKEAGVWVWVWMGMVIVQCAGRQAGQMGCCDCPCSPRAGGGAKVRLLEDWMNNNCVIILLWAFQSQRRNGGGFNGDWIAVGVSEVR